MVSEVLHNAEFDKYDKVYESFGPVRAENTFSTHRNPDSGRACMGDGVSELVETG